MTDYIMGVDPARPESDDASEPHYCGKIICKICGHSWSGVVPCDAPLNQLECPECGSHHAELQP